MTKVITFHHAAIATRDLERSVAFYHDILGLNAGNTPSAKNPLQWMYAGDTPVIHIFEPQAGRGEPDQNRYGVGHLALQIENFNIAKERLEVNRIEFNENFMASTNSRQLFFDGPDGERVELIEFAKSEV